MSSAPPRHRLTARVIGDRAALREVLGEPAALVVARIADRLNAATRPFIERAPFVCLATSDARGRCDVSPRGDPAGFVRILDDRTLLVPDRPGNKMADSLSNILENPAVGLLFVIPGLVDSFRVNGHATVTDDPELLAASVVDGKPPRLGILIDIEEAYTQCGKAFIRSALWDPERFQDRADFPTNGEIFRALKGDDFDVETYDRERAERYAKREGFY